MKIEFSLWNCFDLVFWNFGLTTDKTWWCFLEQTTTFPFASNWTFCETLSSHSEPDDTFSWPRITSFFFLILSLNLQWQLKEIKDAMKKIAERRSARPTSPATASQCIGCKAKMVPAKKMLKRVFKTISAKDTKRNVAIECRITLTRW